VDLKCYREEEIVKKTCIVLSAILLLCFTLTARSESAFAKDGELKPEELVAQHLKSLGSPEQLAQVNSRSIAGTATYKIITGGSGQMPGTVQWVSEKGKMGIVLRFGSADYPGEHLAYDGKDVMVDWIKTGARSPLGDFLYRYSGIMKNELLGGTFYTGWPLLNLKESGAKIKCKKKSVENRELYEVEYQPKKSMEDVKVKMWFDSENFRHVMTEYRLRRSVVGDSMSSKDETFENIVITERFDDFKPVDGITLPFKYSLSFLFQRASTLQTVYTLDIEKIVHNVKIDPQFYAAQK